MTDEKTLFLLANEERKNSYSPYSGITVGAALLCASGKIYLGSNIENSSFSPTVCAERVAFFKAISEGERDFVAIAVAGGARECEPKAQFPPCGVCRQVMAEFCRPDFKIIFGDGKALTLSALLPYGFTGDSIK